MERAALHVMLSTAASLATWMVTSRLQPPILLKTSPSGEISQHTMVSHLAVSTVSECGMGQYCFSCDIDADDFTGEQCDPDSLFGEGNYSSKTPDFTGYTGLSNGAWIKDTGVPGPGSKVTLACQAGFTDDPSGGPGPECGYELEEEGIENCRLGDKDTAVC